MAKKSTLNAKNLEALGAECLARLLMELSAGDAAAKRRLRIELAGAVGPAELAREIRKRLTTITRSKSFIDWHKVQAVANDLENQRRAIIDKVAKADPNEALELLWQFMALASSIVERCEYDDGGIIGIFHNACEDIGHIAAHTNTDPVILADRVYDALIANDYGQYGNIIVITAPALGSKGLAHLKKRITDLSNQPVKRPPSKDRVKIGWSSSGPIYEDEIAERSRKSTVSMALRDIADIQGDVDAFIKQYDGKKRKLPGIAAEVGMRLLAAGRPEEALIAIDAAEHATTGRWNRSGFDWQNARIEVLEALGRAEDAQFARWECFEKLLSPTHLRAYLARLPDFDDIEAEEKALEHVRQSPNLMHALSFLVSWPDLDRAASLVIDSMAELDGNQYTILPDIAAALSARHPLAATLALRPMIDFCLTQSRTTRYKHAARHFLECASLSKSIQDFGKAETHEAYEARLRNEHGKKAAFWNLVA